MQLYQIRLVRSDIDLPFNVNTTKITESNATEKYNYHDRVDVAMVTVSHRRPFYGENAFCA